MSGSASCITRCSCCTICTNNKIKINYFCVLANATTATAVSSVTSTHTALPTASTTDSSTATTTTTVAAPTPAATTATTTTAAAGATPTTLAVTTNTAPAGCYACSIHKSSCKFDVTFVFRS